MMRNNSRSALWIGVLILNLFAVGSGFAQTGKPPGRLTAAKAHLVGTTNFTKVAGAVTPDATDRLDLPSDVAGELRRREILEVFAADRANRFRAAAVLAAPVQIPHNVVGLPIAENDSGTRGFAGISNLTQSAVNSGFSVEPPDQGLAVGNGYVVEAVNGALAVYTDKGQLLSGVAPINQFFGQLPESDPKALHVSDPRCLYDQATNRWFVTTVGYALDANGNITSSQLLIAVSTTSNPTASFMVYSFDVTNDGSDFFPGDCPCIGDQPLLGADASGLYLSTNAFGQTSFQGAQLYMVSKSALAHLVASPPIVHIDQLSAVLPDVEFSFSIQPSFSPPMDPGEAGTEYFVQAMRALRLEQRITVWALGNTAAIDTDPSQLTLQFAVIPSQVYARPVSASQKASSTPLAERAARGGAPGPANEQNLDGNDHRLQQVMFAGGKLWTSVGTALTNPGSPVRDGAAWFVIDVKNPSTGLQTAISSQGYVAGPEHSHLLYPAVGVTASGHAAMVFTLTGEDFFPSAAYWSFGGESIHILAKGVLPEDGFSAYFFNRPRWGDYSAAAVSLDSTIWMATEMIPGGPRKTFANWGTFIARVRTDEDSSEVRGTANRNSGQK
jgi:hypothetical protein